MKRSIIAFSPLRSSVTGRRVECRRTCGYVDNNGRCQNCGPLPVDKSDLTESEKSLADMQREREIAQRIKRDRLLEA